MRQNKTLQIDPKPKLVKTTGKDEWYKKEQDARRKKHMKRKKKRGYQMATCNCWLFCDCDFSQDEPNGIEKMSQPDENKEIETDERNG